MDNKIKTLSQCAMMLALATLLSLLAVFHLPNGGAVTIGSMLPLFFLALKFNWRWGLLTAFAYSLLQMMFGFYAPPTQDLLSFVLVVLLDYVVAFGVLGLSGVFYRRLNGLSDKNRILAAMLICFFLRFLCHFLSGILIWDVYAPAGQPVWLYSLGYNGSYMAVEALISGIFVWLAGNRLLERFKEM